MTLRDLKIERRPIESLTPYAGNARKHSRKQIAQIARSISEFGFSNPVLVDETGLILAGHGRVEAARLLGLDRIPCVAIEQLTESQKRAFILADNRLAQSATWDEEILAGALRICMMPVRLVVGSGAPRRRAASRPATRASVRAAGAARPVLWARAGSPRPHLRRAVRFPARNPC